MGVFFFFFFFPSFHRRGPKKFRETHACPRAAQCARSSSLCRAVSPAPRRTRRRKRPRPRRSAPWLCSPPFLSLSLSPRRGRGRRSETGREYARSFFASSTLHLMDRVASLSLSNNNGRRRILYEKSSGRLSRGKQVGGSR